MGIKAWINKNVLGEPDSLLGRPITSSDREVIGNWYNLRDKRPKTTYADVTSRLRDNDAV